MNNNFGTPWTMLPLSTEEVLALAEAECRAALADPSTGSALKRHQADDPRDNVIPLSLWRVIESMAPSGQANSSLVSRGVKGCVTSILDFFKK